MKKKISVLLMLVLAFSMVTFTGCEEQSSDEAFLDALVNGLEARWTLTDKFEGDNAADETKTDWESFFNAEYEQIKDFKDAEFENADLGKWAKKYINSIEASKDCLQYYGTNQWDEKYFNGAYQSRVEALYMINSIQKIEVSEEYDGDLSSLITDGEVSNMVTKLLKEVKFKETKNDYGWKTYQAVVENTSSADFDYFAFTVALIDKDGVTISTQDAYVEKWNSGEKIRFEFETDEDFEEMNVKYASWNF